MTRPGTPDTDPIPRIRRYVTNNRIPDRDLRTLIMNPDPTTRSELTLIPNVLGAPLPIDVIHSLVTDPSSTVRANTVRNIPHLTDNLLTTLARDPAPKVRLAVAQHPGHLPELALWLLAGDQTPDVQAALAARRDLPDTLTPPASTRAA